MIKYFMKFHAILFSLIVRTHGGKLLSMDDFVDYDHLDHLQDSILGRRSDGISQMDSHSLIHSAQKERQRPAVAVPAGNNLQQIFNRQALNYSSSTPPTPPMPPMPPPPLPSISASRQADVASRSVRDTYYYNYYGNAAATTAPSSYYYYYGQSAAKSEEKQATCKQVCTGNDLCGLSSVKIPLAMRIVGGKRAKPNMFPWIISYQGFNSKKKFAHRCGGSLIHPQWALTAAHCMYEPSDGTPVKVKNLQVILGEWHLTSSGGTEQIMKIEKYMKHQEYNKENQDNDVCLLKFTTPATINKWVRPICFVEETVKAGQTCIASGWGLTQGTGDRMYLNWIFVPHVPPEVCGSKKYYGQYYKKGMTICFGYSQGGKDSCQGDSGGPLVCRKRDGDSEDKNRFYLHGSTSWGEGCAQKRRPGIYSNVEYFTPWVKSVMKEEGFADVTFGKKECKTICAGGNEKGTENVENLGVDDGVCGRASPMPLKASGHRIVGGEEAKRHSHPWQATLRYRHRKWAHQCGGSLINKFWILTAAHCMINPLDGTPAKEGDIRVVLGEHDENKQEGTEQVMDIEKIYKHPQYAETDLSHDITLLKLKQIATYNAYVKPICLPDFEIVTTPGRQPDCVVAGWGLTYGTGDRTKLRQVKLPLLPERVCGSKKYYGSRFNAKRTFCAGKRNSGKDSCQGDSGGPLTCRYKDRMVQHGVVSWGEGCAVKAGIYTRLSFYLNWIKATIKEHNT